MHTAIYDNLFVIEEEIMLIEISRDAFAEGSTGLCCMM